MSHQVGDALLEPAYWGRPEDEQQFRPAVGVQVRLVLHRDADLLGLRLALFLVASKAPHVPGALGNTGTLVVYHDNCVW